MESHQWDELLKRVEKIQGVLEAIFATSFEPKKESSEAVTAEKANISIIETNQRHARHVDWTEARAAKTHRLSIAAQFLAAKGCSFTTEPETIRMALRTADLLIAEAEKTPPEAKP